MIGVIKSFAVFSAEVLEEYVHGHDGDSAEDSLREHAETTKAAYGCSTPDCCSGRETFDGVTIFENDTCAEETDTGNDLRDDTTVIAVKHRRRHEDIERAADSDERDSTRSGHLTMQLALHTNEVTQGGRKEQFGNQQQPISLQERVKNSVHGVFSFN